MLSLECIKNLYVGAITIAYLLIIFWPLISKFFDLITNWVELLSKSQDKRKKYKNTANVILRIFEFFIALVLTLSSEKVDYLPGAVIISFAALALMNFLLKQIIKKAEKYFRKESVLIKIFTYLFVIIVLVVASVFLIIIPTYLTFGKMVDVTSYSVLTVYVIFTIADVIIRVLSSPEK